MVANGPYLLVEVGLMMATNSSRVLLVRHGRTVLNAENRLRGRLDPELDDVGRAEGKSQGQSPVTAVEVIGAVGVIVGAQGSGRGLTLAPSVGVGADVDGHELCWIVGVGVEDWAG